MNARRHAVLTVLAGAALLAAPALAAAHGATPPQELREHWWSAWSLSPLELIPTALGALLYGLRARRLGERLPRWRSVCFFSGIAVLVLAINSPIDPIGEDALFSIHMLQHVLLGDIAALLIVLGVTGPVLRPALALHWVQRLRVLTHPLVALPLWAASLYLWHLPVLYEASLSNEAVHLAEHVCFFTFGCLMWAAVIEPLPGPVWFGTGAKLGYIAVVRAAETLLGNIFWFGGSVFYEDYAERAPLWGIDALQDQINAGTVMMFEGGAVTIAALIVFGFRLSREGPLRQALIEAGMDPQRARRVVRYGRGWHEAAKLGLRRRPDGEWVREEPAPAPERVGARE